jgi:hypothetical protein
VVVGKRLDLDPLYIREIAGCFMSAKKTRRGHAQKGDQSKEGENINQFEHNPTSDSKLFGGDPRSAPVLAEHDNVRNLRAACAPFLDREMLYDGVT